MTDLESVRASSLPLAFLCPGSLRGMRVDPVNPYAALGTASHEAVQPLVETGSVGWDDLPRIAQKHNVDFVSLKVNCAQATTMWNRIKDSFPHAISEVGLLAPVSSELDLTGHLDVLSSLTPTVRILDWKFGFKDANHYHQMMGYATLAFFDDPTIGSIRAFIGWVKSGELEPYTITRPQSAEWLRELKENVINWDGIYHPGAHCTFCPRSHDCIAANAMSRRDVAAISNNTTIEKAVNEIHLMKPSDVIELHSKADQVTRAAKMVLAAIRSEVLEHGDIVADGVRLATKVTNKRQVDPQKAWGVLEDAGFDQDDLADCVKMSISKVEQKAREKAPKRQGAAKVRELTTALEKAGAVSIDEVKGLERKRADT